MLAFALLALVASFLHLPLFSFAGASAWVWFGLLGATGALVASRLVQAKQ
jgi:hypothetical protein